MRHVVLGAACLLSAGFVGAGPAGLGAAGDDDLAVVKRAVASAPAVSATRGDEAAPQRRKGAEPQWFKVRIVDKGAKKARVTINLPLSLVRALGDDVPLDLGCHPRCASAVKLSEILASLDAGQSLVEIDDDDAHVRVWLE